MEGNITVTPITTIDSQVAVKTERLGLFRFLNQAITKSMPGGGGATGDHLMFLTQSVTTMAPPL